MEKVLVIGADGLIGRALSNHLRANTIPVVVTSRRESQNTEYRLSLDLSQDVSDWEPPQDVTVAYLCAAITSLETCRANPEYSELVNVHNIVRVGQKLAKNHIFTIFLSSSLVFDGTHPYPKTDDPVSPITTYGHQKAEAERRLLALTPPVTVVRFSKVMGPNMPLINGWIQSLRNEQVIHPFLDMMISPISLDDAIQVLVRMMEQRVKGIIQVSASKDISYADVASYIAQRIGARMELVQPITSVEAGIYLEAVPASTAFDISRLQSELKIPPPDIWAAIDRVIFQ